MVKRPKSPEPVDDTKFLTVLHPYPMNANMEVPEDFKEFMYWLASVVGKDYALGVYHKPTARGMVVAEISKSFQDFDRLLGEHSWSKFLVKPSTEARQRKTRVYYSTYSSGRGLQKDGWKNILADDDIFNDFIAINRKIAYPYPIPVWCDVPPEDPTNKRMCRPLPVQTKAPPMRAPVPVPGSSTWISQKGGGKPPMNPPFATHKGGPFQKGNVQAVNSKGKMKSPSNPDAWKTPIIPPPMNNKSSSAPGTSSSTMVSSSKSAWSTPFTPAGPPTTSNTSATPPFSDFSTPRSASPASATAGTDFSVPVSLPSTISRSYTSPPPRLGPPNLQLPTGKPTNPLGSSSIALLHNQFATSSIGGSSASIVASPSEGGYYGHDELGSDEDDDDDEFEFPNASVVASNSDFIQNVEPRMGKGQGKGKFSSGNVVYQPPALREQKEDRDRTGDLWSKVAQKPGRTFRKVIAEDDLCPVHGVICSKGICSVMKKKRREKEWKEKEDKRDKDRKERKRAKEREKRGYEKEEGEETEKEGKEAERDTNELPTGNVAQTPVTSAAHSKAATSVVGSVGSSAKSQSHRTGEWGPKKKRNAKKRGQIPEEVEDDDKLESTTVSSARPTYGEPSVASSVVFSDVSAAGSIATVSAIISNPPSMTFSYSAMKPTPTRSPASASVSTSAFAVSSIGGGRFSMAGSSSAAATIGYNNTDINGKSRGDAVVNGKGKSAIRPEPTKTSTMDKGKNRATTPTPNNIKGKGKTWIEMMDDDDGSTLGSLPDF